MFGDIVDTFWTAISGGSNVDGCDELRPEEGVVDAVGLGWPEAHRLAAEGFRSRSLRDSRLTQPPSWT